MNKRRGEKVITEEAIPREDHALKWLNGKQHREGEKCYANVSPWHQSTPVPQSSSTVGEMQTVFPSRASLCLRTRSVPHCCPRAQALCFASATLAADRLPVVWSLASSRVSDGQPLRCRRPDAPPPGTSRHRPGAASRLAPTVTPVQAAGPPLPRELPLDSHSKRAARSPPPPRPCRHRRKTAAMERARKATQRLRGHNWRHERSRATDPPHRHVGTSQLKAATAQLALLWERGTGLRADGWGRRGDPARGCVCSAAPPSRALPPPGPRGRRDRRPSAFSGDGGVQRGRPQPPHRRRRLRSPPGAPSPSRPCPSPRPCCPRAAAGGSAARAGGPTAAEGGQAREAAAAGRPREAKGTQRRVPGAPCSCGRARLERSGPARGPPGPRGAAGTGAHRVGAQRGAAPRPGLPLRTRDRTAALRCAAPNNGAAGLCRWVGPSGPYETRIKRALPAGVGQLVSVAMDNKKTPKQIKGFPW